VLDKAAVKKAMKEDRYDSVKGLSIYFALERRWSVLVELLQTIDLLATMDFHSFNVILSSDVPVDLTRYNIESPFKIMKSNN
jgi:hypothetical protein